MTCEECGEVLISDSNFKRWCANCSSEHILLSKEDTLKILEELYNDLISQIERNYQSFNASKLIQKIHELREVPTNSFFMDFFSWSILLGVIYKEFIKSNGAGKGDTPRDSDLNTFKELTISLYLSKHQMYFTKYDAVRFVKFPPNEISGIKFTENWWPIFKRQFMMGNLPSEPDISSEKSIDLYSEYIFRGVVLEDLHNINHKYEHITQTLEILQGYQFHFPWNDYSNVGRDEADINLFLKISKMLIREKGFSLDDFNVLEEPIKTFINQRKWITNKDNLAEFPFIIQLDKQLLIPRYFLSRIHQIHNLFKSSNANIFRTYKRELGHTLENRLFEELHNYNLDFYSPTTSKQELIRFPNPFKKGFELFDVGVIDHQTKKFYIIECKNKTQLDLRTYDPNILNGFILDDFEEFRDRDIPDIEKLIAIWKMDDYELIPMFYNIVPLFGEFKKFKKFTLLDNIYVIQNKSEIGAIININFHVNGLGFDEVSNLPPKFKDIVNGNIDLKINPSIEQDIGHLISEPDEKYQILISKIAKVDINNYISELWVKRNREPYILYIDIPTELIQAVKDLNLKKHDKVSTLIYRKRPHHPVITLGKVWKLS